MSLDPTRLCQIEIFVSDLERSKKFYHYALGWPPSPCDLHEYEVLQVPEDCPFGISLVPRSQHSPKSSSQNNLVLYFACDDPSTLLQKVEGHGGKKIPSHRKLSGYGKVQLFEDPDGQRFGLFSRL